MSLVVYWSALALILFTYAGFPCVVCLRGFLWRRSHRKGDVTPSVSFIIAAHNEAKSIGGKIDNVLSLDYPPERMEVLVASDGSTDATEEIVAAYANRGVRLLPLPRQGKAAALNASVDCAGGEILIFSDANSMFSTNALRELVRPFNDPEVGGVAGDQQYLKSTGGGAAADGERCYWNFDRFLKQCQSRSGNVTSATGAIYAIRRSLFLPVPEGVTDDFVTSTRVVAQNHRLVFAPRAIAYEPVSEAKGTEFGRKVRIITRGLRGVWTMRRLLNPLRHGFYSLQLFSHKVLRRLMVFPLLLLLLDNILLWSKGLFYQTTLAGQLAFYGFALLGWMLADTRLGKTKLFSLPFFFCLVNVASFVAVIHFFTGRRIVVWEPQRSNCSPKRVTTSTS